MSLSKKCERRSLSCSTAVTCRQSRRRGSRAGCRASPTAPRATRRLAGLVAARTSSLLERVEQLLDRRSRASSGSDVARRRRAQAHRCASRGLLVCDGVTRSSAPAVTSAARTAARSLRVERHERQRSTFSHLPIIASAALTGIGFDSTNAARIHGSSAMMDLARRGEVARARRARRAAPSTSARRSTSPRRCRRRRAPSPGSVSSSSPERTLKSRRAVPDDLARSAQIARRLLHADDVRGCSASSSVVFASMLLPVRPGTL